MLPFSQPYHLSTSTLIIHVLLHKHTYHIYPQAHCHTYPQAHLSTSTLLILSTLTYPQAVQEPASNSCPASPSRSLYPQYVENPHLKSAADQPN